MLVLSRKAGQKILIGGDIEIIVSRISGNRVTLGIRAPKELRVLRQELPKHKEDGSNENDAQLSGPPTIDGEEIAPVMLQGPFGAVQSITTFNPTAG